MVLEAGGFKHMVAASGERLVLCHHMVERSEGKLVRRKSDEIRGSLASWQPTLRRLIQYLSAAPICLRGRPRYFLHCSTGDQLMNSGGRAIGCSKGKLFLVASLAPI